MLDDANVIKQRDPSRALSVVASQYDQARFTAEVQNKDHDGRVIKNIIVAGMGGSALAALLAKSWLETEFDVPFEIVRSYHLPAYIGSDTFVIVSSYSGNTEESLSCLEQAKSSGAQIATITSGGELMTQAEQNSYASVKLPSDFQPRMAVIYNLCALVSLLVNFEVLPSAKLDEIANTSEWLRQETDKWSYEIETSDNYAKQLAEKAVGKTAIFYGGRLTAPIAYKWKISWNENAKNVAFWNELPEFNHNEFLGWTSHPIEKPFAVFDIISSFENPRILKRFEVTDRLLSGMRPKSTVINLAGDNPIKQLLWGSILADYVSIYLAILNNVDPTPVVLIEKLKQELA